MIDLDKLRDIAKRLLERSRKNDVHWQEVEREHRGATGYEVQLPSSMIRVEHRSPETEPDNILVIVCGQRGEIIASLDADASTPDWPLLNDLYAEAHRYVTGWDRILKDIDEAIQKPGKIGIASAK
jgi:hypothetical protein